MKHLLVVALIAFAILLAAIYFSDANARARARTATDRVLAARAQDLAESLDRLIQFRMSETFTFAALPSLRAFAATDESARAARTAVAQNELQAIAAADPNIRAAAIVDASGKIILATDSSIGSMWSERAFVREALSGHLYTSPPSRDFGEISNYYSAPILDNAGNVAAALVLRIAAQEMWGVLNPQANGFVVDEYGVRIADKSPQFFSTIAPLAPQDAARALAEKRYGAEPIQIRPMNLRELAAAIKNVRTSSLVYRDADGSAMRAAIQLLRTNPWTVVVFESEDAVEANNTLTDLITVGALAAIVGAGWGYAVANFFVRGE